MAPTWTFFFLTWKLAERPTVFPLFSFSFFFYCLEQRTLLSIYCRLDLTIISEGLKHFYMPKKTVKSRLSLLCSRTKDHCPRRDSTVFNYWKKDIPCQAWGGISYERHMPGHALVPESRKISTGRVCPSLDESERWFLYLRTHYSSFNGAK